MLNVAHIADIVAFYESLTDNILEAISRVFRVYI